MAQKRSDTHKTMSIIIKVSVPLAMTAEDARREVRTLISEQCNWRADEGDIRCLSANAVPRPLNLQMSRIGRKKTGA